MARFEIAMIVAFVLFIAGVIWYSAYDSERREAVCQSYGEHSIRTGKYSDHDYVFCVKKDGTIVARKEQ